MSQLPPHKWVLLTHQLPSQPPGLRVKVWRRLQGLGAVAVRQSVYVLPAGRQALEDFQWLRQEIGDAGGEAIVFTADVVDGAEDEQIVRTFQQARQRDYTVVLKQLCGLERTCREGDDSGRTGNLRRLRQRLEHIAEIDFFQAAGKAEALAALQRCEVLLQTPKAARPGPEPAALDSARYRKRRWVTRRNLHIDRMASAWLIRRYIDPEARFAFVDEGAPLRPDDVTFDMFESEFGHREDRCTFESLKASFRVRAPGVEAIAHIVHDADLKDGKFGRTDTTGIEKTVRALGARLPDDKLVEVGMHLFDGLTEIFSTESMA